MKCPCCSTEAKSTVKETRMVDNEIARRRECTSCGKLFTTRELHDPEFVLRKVRPTKTADRRRTNNNDLFKAWSRV